MTARQYGNCPDCGFTGELHGDCVVESHADGTLHYRERWICAREDQDSIGYVEGWGCNRTWWERFNYVGGE